MSGFRRRLQLIYPTLNAMDETFHATGIIPAQFHPTTCQNQLRNFSILEVQNPSS